MIFLKKLLLATVKFGPPIFTSVVLTKHGNTGYVLLCVCESPHRHQKMILKRTKTIMRKFYQMSRTFLKKLVPCRESNSGSLRWLRASVPLLLITAGNPFPRFNHFHHRARISNAPGVLLHRSLRP